jgi:predicted transcriptional regulator
MKDLNTMNSTPNQASNILDHVSRIVAAYITSHKTPLEDISAVVTRVFQSLSSIENNPQGLTAKAHKEPAVPINESVHDDYIVCLEDGKKLHMLKRHLGSMYRMTLDEYKARWSLPHDYPTVSPSYARRRSSIAKNTGLGKTGRKKRHLKAA